MQPFSDFSLTLIIDARRDDASDVAVIDYRQPCCYLYETPKVWEFHFSSLVALAQEVLRIRERLVEKVLQPVKPQRSKQPLYIKVQDGVVREVCDIPAGLEVVVLDYDTENADPEAVALSPLDGKPCFVCRF